MTFSIVFLSTGALWDGCYVLPLRHFPNKYISKPAYGGDIATTRHDYGAVGHLAWMAYMINEVTFNLEHEQKSRTH